MASLKEDGGDVVLHVCSECAVVPLFNKATHPADKKWFEKEDGLS